MKKVATHNRTRRPGHSSTLALVLILAWLAQLTGGAIHFLTVNHVYSPTSGKLAHLATTQPLAGVPRHHHHHHHEDHGAAQPTHGFAWTEPDGTQRYALHDCQVLAVHRDRALVPPSPAPLPGPTWQCGDSPHKREADRPHSTLDRFCIAPKQSPPLA